MRGFEYKKTVQVLNHFAKLSGGKLNKMKALKLIWLSDRLHLRTYGRTITGDSYYAMKFGPVASNTRDILEENNSFLSDEEKQYSNQYLSVIGKNYFKSIADPYYKILSESDLEIIQETFNQYGDFDQFYLSKLSHEFPEWKRWELDLNKGFARHFLMEFEDFFQNQITSTKLSKSFKEELDLVKNLYLRSESSAC